MEDIIHNFEEIDHQMSGIIYDLNKSRYNNAHIDYSETETSKTNHKEMDKDTLQFENTLQPQQRPNRENAGRGIYIHGNKRKHEKKERTSNRFKSVK